MKIIFVGQVMEFEQSDSKKVTITYRNHIITPHSSIPFHVCDDEIKLGLSQKCVACPCENDKDPCMNRSKTQHMHAHHQIMNMNKCNDMQMKQEYLSNPKKQTQGVNNEIYNSVTFNEELKHRSKVNEENKTRENNTNKSLTNIDCCRKEARTNYNLTYSNCSKELLTVRTYEIKKHLPTSGITTYIEFQQFDLRDFYHINETLLDSVTYQVQHPINFYEEFYNGEYLFLTINFNTEFDMKYHFMVENYETEIVKQLVIDKKVTYKIKIIHSVNFSKSESLEYVLQSDGFIYRFCSKISLDCRLSYKIACNGVQLFVNNINGKEIYADVISDNYKCNINFLLIDVGESVQNIFFENDIEKDKNFYCKVIMQDYTFCIRNNNIL
ncbi:hypothetical protein COBT_000026 [Conglomerata obtusa]